MLNLRASGDGTHSVAVALHPADLGPVNLHVRIVDGAMAISLASANGATLDSIRTALPELRQELRQAGLPDVKLSLDLTAGEFTGQQDPHDAPGQLRPNSFDTGGALAPNTPLRWASPSRPPANIGLDRWL